MINLIRRCEQQVRGKFFAFQRLSIESKGSYFLRPLHPRKTGIDILHDPVWNKDLAFEYYERDRLRIRGLLPVALQSMQAQVERVMRELQEEPDNVRRNLILSDIQNRNETLFHRVLVDNIETLAPIVYTPTVGMVCQQFGFRFNRPRGMYLNISEAGMLNSVVQNWPHHDVHLIVVTDGSKILGLGDLGAQGMCIPIGKLALYCAIGGIAPHRVLPIQLDVGTNNETLLEDPNYVGLRQPRVLGEAYFKFLDEFMEAVTQRWPRVAIQFEDFETTKAIPLLERYRSKYLCFNDDIQGSGAVILSSILSATRQIDLDNFDKSNLTNHRILCLGAGAGGLGICTQLLAAMVAQGLTKEDAKNHFVICSSRGALGKPDGKHGDPHHHITCKLSTSVNKSQWYHSEISDGTTVEEVIETFKPTVLLGLTGKANSFTERMLQRVTEHCQRPIILPMSSPASNCECTPEQAYSWTQGRAIVATGTSFDPVTLPTEHKEGGRNHSITLHPSQCNNTFIFPGLGLACSIGGIKRLPDELFLAAAHACAQTVSKQEILRGQCFPDVNRVREVSHAVACGVLTEALKLKLVTKFTVDDFADEGLQSYVDRKMYFPDYAPLC